MDTIHSDHGNQDMELDQYDATPASDLVDFDKFLQYEDGGTDGGFRQNRDVDISHNGPQVLQAHQQRADYTFGQLGVNNNTQTVGYGGHSWQSDVLAESVAPAQEVPTVGGLYRLPGTSLRWSVVDVDNPHLGVQNFMASHSGFQGQGTYGAANVPISPQSHATRRQGSSTVPAMSSDGMLPDHVSLWPKEAIADPGAAFTYPTTLPELASAPMAPRHSRDTPWNYPMVAAGEMPQLYRHEPSTTPYQAESSTPSYNRPTTSPGNSWGQHRDDETNATR
ncbi:hypothetical protein E8E11_001487 [Didymella keratinophila]|nr:hypothetical protein E8E11_001487 [Didymella keratinophila]